MLFTGYNNIYNRLLKHTPQSTTRVIYNYASTLLPDKAEFQILTLTSLQTEDDRFVYTRQVQESKLSIEVHMLKNISPNNLDTSICGPINRRWIQYLNTKGADDEQIIEITSTLVDRNYREIKVPALLQYPTMFIRIYCNDDLSHFVVLSSKVNIQLINNINAVYIKEYFETYTTVKTEDETVYEQFLQFIDNIWYDRGDTLNEMLEWMYPNYAEKLRQELKEKRKINIENTVQQLDRSKIERINNSINETKDMIENYENALASCYVKLQDYLSRKAGMQLGGETSEAIQNLMHMFEKENSNIVDITITPRGHIQFFVRTTLKFWELDEYNRLTKGGTRSGYLHTASELQIAVINKIFKTKEIKIHMAECVDIDTYDTAIRFVKADASEFHTKPYYEEQQGIPNPHHYYFNCWGDNKMPIREAMINGEYDIAINQIIAAVASVNVVDNAVFGKFVAALMGNESSPLYAITKYLKAYEYKGNMYTLPELYHVIQIELAEARKAAMSAETENTETVES